MVSGEHLALALMSPAEDNSEKKNGWIQLAKYSQLAFVIPAATVAGWFLGLAMDRWLHTTWLYLAGLILGIIAGFIELIRAALSSDSNSDSNSNPK